ncbi:MAG: A/G-specific adenine glycosylase [Myxococcota bacterium]|nr:A/G-specific adenine glycosylase [Myxococcota bacterium]
MEKIRHSSTDLLEWNEGVVPRVRKALLKYYLKHHRDLPWRHTRDPYEILVSEVMLQQTQVKTVAPRYTEFLRRFPTVESLAEASEEVVCESWAGLGYYRRARNLRRAASQIVDDFEGEFPQTAKELEKLHGVGRYTAGAVASIAFEQNAPIVDGNVIRVFTRVFRFNLPKENSRLLKTIWAIAEEIAQGTAPGQVNQAIMEHGATICTPGKPDCRSCCIQKFCGAYLEGEPTRYPLSLPKKKKKKLAVAFAWCEQDGKLLLEQRPVDGLWAGLWEPPSAVEKDKSSALKVLQSRLNTTLRGPIVKVKHLLTHREVTALVYITDRPAGLRNHGWYEEPLKQPLSGLAKKAIIAMDGIEV